MLDKTWIQLMEIWPELSALEQQVIVDAAKKLVKGEDVEESQDDADTPKEC